MFEIISLKKTYHNSDGDVLALKGINTKIGDKGIVFLFGQSGEGKSTLLNILSGLDDYEKDSKVLYNGQDIMTMTQKQRDNYRSKEIGLIFERENYVDCLTVKENIKLAMPLSGYEVNENKVQDALKRVKLENLADRKLSELSSGELQRVAIARELATDPRVLFVDEPTGHLDKENSEIFWNFVKEISQKALVIAITHEKDIVDKYADRVLEIKAGEIVNDTYKNQSLKTEDQKLFDNFKPTETKAEARASLSFKSSFKLSWKFLTKNLFRFISTMVLICLTLTIFGVCYLVGVFNPYQVLAKSSKKQHLSYVSFENNYDREIDDGVLDNIYNSYTGEYYKLYTINQKMELTNSEINFNGMLEAVQADSSEVNSIGQKVLYGKYPLDTDSDNKIAISDYFAYLMIKNGVTFYTSNGEGVLNASSNLQDVVNKSYIIEQTRYEVVAIFETNFREFTTDHLTIKSGCEEDFNYYNNTVYSVMHVVPSKAIAIIQNKEYASDVILAFESNKSSVLANRYQISNQDYAVNSEIEYNIFGTKQWLTENEVVLPLSVFNKLYNCNVTDILDENSFINAIGNNSTIKLTSYYGFSEEFTVVGLTSGETVIFANNSTNINGRIGEIVKHCVYPVMHIVVPVKSEMKFASQIELLAKNDLTYTGRYAEPILDLTNLVSDLNIVFVVSTVFMSLFSIWLMFTFFVTFASANKRSIGALRTMGANSLNLFLIFIIACLMLAGVGMVCGMVFSSIASVILNAIISKRFALPISVFNLNFGMFAFMLLICFTITVVGSIIPIARYCKKTPVDVIKR